MTGVKILVNGQAANLELVKGQAHLRVKGQDIKCLGAELVGVAKCL